MARKFNPQSPRVYVIQRMQKGIKKEGILPSGGLEYVDPITRIWNLIQEGYVPIASGQQLQTLNSVDNPYEGITGTYGKDTQFQGKYTAHIFGGKFIQVKDIDLQQQGILNWMPVGSVSGIPPFMNSIYDGNNHSIKNMKISLVSNEDLSMIGLFGFAVSTGEQGISIFKNIKLKNIEYYIPQNYNGQLIQDDFQYISGLCGSFHGDNSYVENCSVENFSIDGRGVLGNIIKILVD